MAGKEKINNVVYLLVGRGHLVVTILQRDPKQNTPCLLIQTDYELPTE